MRDVRFGKWPVLGRQWSRIIDHGIPNGSRYLVVRCVGKADVQNSLLVMSGHADSSVHRLNDIGLEQLALTEDSDAGSIPIQKIPVLGQL